MKIEREDIKVLYSLDEIREAARKLGKEITNFYKDKTDIIHTVCILKGAIHFFTELVLNIDLDVVYSFVHVTSYSGTDSTGRIRVKSWLDEDLEDKYLLIVEDVIDTGLTLRYLMKYLKKYRPRDIRIAALAEKTAHDHGIDADFVAFELQDQFLLGYGLDYDERFRNLPFLGYLDK